MTKITTQKTKNIDISPREGTFVYIPLFESPTAGEANCQLTARGLSPMDLCSGAAWTLIYAAENSFKVKLAVSGEGTTESGEVTSESGEVTSAF